MNPKKNLLNYVFWRLKRPTSRELSNSRGIAAAEFVLCPSSLVSRFRANRVILLDRIRGYRHIVYDSCVVSIVPVRCDSGTDNLNNWFIRLWTPRSNRVSPSRGSTISVPVNVYWPANMWWWRRFTVANRVFAILRRPVNFFWQTRNVSKPILQTFYRIVARDWSLTVHQCLGVGPKVTFTRTC